MHSLNEGPRHAEHDESHGRTTNFPETGSFPPKVFDGKLSEVIQVPLAVKNYFESAQPVELEAKFLQEARPYLFF